MESGQQASEIQVTTVPDNDSNSQRVGQRQMPPSKSMHHIFGFDNTLGYKYGTFMWSTFFLIQAIGLCVDDTQGVARNYLTLGATFSLFTFMYYAHTQTRLLPASTASLVCMTPECLFRLLLAAYYGLSNVTGSDTIGGINWFTFVSSCVFGTMTYLQIVYSNFYFKEYKQYEKEMVDKMLGENLWQQE